MLRLIRDKYYIYIYGENPLYIAVPIGAQSQQGNMSPNSILLHTQSFQDQTTNLLASEIFSQPPPPLPGVLQLQ